MRLFVLRTVIWAVVLAILAGCTAPAPSTPDRSAPAPDRGATAAGQEPKRIVTAIRGELAVLNDDIQAATGRTIPGGEVVYPLVSAGFAKVDDAGTLRPELGETVPTVENGLWRVFPDGRMETTYRINPGAVWHDGTPVTSDDLLFTASVGRDGEIPSISHRPGK